MSAKTRRTRLPCLGTAVLLAAAVTACGGIDADAGDGNGGGPANSAQVTSGWGPSNGQWYLYGARAMPIIEDATGLDITVRESAGTEENAIRMERGDLEVAMLDADGAVEALGPDHQLTQLFPLSVVIWQLVVGADTSIEDVADLNGVSFNPGPVGGASAMVTEQVFEDGLGLDIDWFHATAPDAQSAYQGRQIDGFALRGAGTVADGAVLEVDSARPVRLLSLTDEQMAAAMEVNENLVPSTIPADAYGTDEDIQAMGYWGVVVGASTDLDEDVAYQITKGFWEEQEAIAAHLPQVEGMTEEDAVNEALMPLHPGAVRYYEEIGLDVPDDLRAGGR